MGRRAPCRNLVLCLRAAACPFREPAPRPKRGSPRPAAVPGPGGRTAGTAVSPTRPLAGKDTHLSEPRAAHRKSRCLHGELCARARGPQLPTPLPHGKQAEPQRQGSWSGPLPPSSTPVPVPDCPGHPPNRHPRAGTVPLPLPPCGGWGGRWRQPPGSPAPRLSPSPAFPSWVTLTQRTCGVPIYLQNIKKFIIYILTPVLPFYTCTSLEKVKIFKKRKRKGITRWE